MIKDIFLKIIKDYWKYFLGFLVISALIPLIMDWCIIGNPIKSNIGNDVWVGFLGSYIGAIIGAFITLIGVMITINFTSNESKKDRQLEMNKFKEDKRVSIAPYLKYNIQKGILNEYDHDMHIFDVVDNDYNKVINATVLIKNIGLGPLVDLEVTDMYFKDKKCCYDKITAVPGVIEKGEHIQLLIDIRIKLEEIRREELIEERDSTIGIVRTPPEKYYGKGGILKFRIHYKDLLGNQYKQALEVSIGISLIGDSTQTKWKYSEPEIRLEEIGEIEFIGKLNNKGFL